MYNSGRGPKKNLLVVDDHNQNAQAVADFFNLRGFAVHTAASAHEALAVVLQESIDLVLLKSHLPGLSGYEIGPMLKKIKPGIRVIFMMVEAQQELSQKSEENMFFECFSAPLDLDKVLKAINV